MIQRINTTNCAVGNWSSYQFIGNNHNFGDIPLTFKVSAWCKFGTYEDSHSWCCLFGMDIPWSDSWEDNI